MLFKVVGGEQPYLWYQWKSIIHSSKIFLCDIGIHKYLTLIWKILSHYYFKYFFCFFLSFSSFWYPHYIYVIHLVAVPQFFDFPFLFFKLFFFFLISLCFSVLEVSLEKSWSTQIRSLVIATPLLNPLKRCFISATVLFISNISLLLEFSSPCLHHTLVFACCLLYPLAALAC